MNDDPELTALSPAHTSFDLPLFEGLPKNFYVICSTPRTGSTLLGKLMCSSGYLGAPTEFFHRKHLTDFAKRFCLIDSNGNINIQAYLGELFKRRTSSNGVFGVKCHYDQFAPFVANRAWEGLFPDVKFVYIIREDILSQAISLAIASQTNAYSSQEEAECEPIYSATEITRWVEYIAELNKRWNVFFGTHGLNPYFMTYEDLISNTKSVCRRVCQHLDVDMHGHEFGIQDSQMKKQGNEVNLQWKSRFANSTS